MTTCEYYHPSCAVGCSKVQCRARFPEKAPIIMDSQKPICKSDEHLECLIRMDGLEYHAERIRNRKGCPFLTNNQCGKPNNWWCHGHIPPFLINDEKVPNNKNIELLQACFGNEYKNCPNYVIGVRFREEANRIARERGIKDKST